MTPHTKFDFDTEFDGDGAIASAPVRFKPYFAAEEVDALVAAARAEGDHAATARIEADTQRALADIATSVRAALPTLVQVAHEHRAGSAELALAAARTIADAAFDLFPDAPARAALEALAREVESSPRLTVRVPADVLERVQAALEETGRAIGFAGQIVAVVDPNAPRAAFTFDWGDGKASFDPVKATQRVADALSAALASEGLHGEALAPLVTDENPHV